MVEISGTDNKNNLSGSLESDVIGDLSSKENISLAPNNWQSKIRDFIFQIESKLYEKFEQLIPKYSLLEDTAFFDSEKFSWTPHLENNWQIIRQELDIILQHTEELPNFQDMVSNDDYSFNKDSLWKTYFLYGCGIKNEKNCQRCPETTGIIESIPGMKTAYFSILLPGKHLPEHRGMFKGVIRCLLGLKIPKSKEKCRIRVVDEIKHWEEGKAMFFDDSFKHEVWNETDEVRVVLFLDIVRPMRFPLSWVNMAFIKLMPIFIVNQDDKDNHKKWDKKLEKLFDRQKS